LRNKKLCLLAKLFVVPKQKVSNTASPKTQKVIWQSSITEHLRENSSFRELLRQE
jgi:hypothetical protein